MEKRVITNYICEYCGYTSTDKERIEKCEQAHESIDNVICSALYSNGNSFPYRIAVKSKSGEYIGYYKRDTVEQL